MRLLGHLPVSLLLLISSSSTLTTAAHSDERPDGLIVEQTSGPVICERPTRNGDIIAMDYKGMLEDGTEFDESYKRGKPFQFKLGVGQVIQGWDLGLIGMCIGQSRKLTIPAKLGYGSRGAGGLIPPNAILIFETKLVDIVTPMPDPTTTTAAVMSIATAPPTPPGTDADADPVEQTNEIFPPKEDPDIPPDQVKCHMFGPFALLVQSALGAMAILTLVFKRYREKPRRPWKIFFFDVSKQVFGSVLTHIINLAMSELGSADMVHAAQNAAAKAHKANGGRSPNPCSFYLLNLAIDTTLGVPVLYVLLKILHALFLRTPLANPPESIKSGNYDVPPRWAWYYKQLLIYCIGLTIMKLFVLLLFQMLPWLPWIGDWMLRWTEGNEALQITFAMFIFPLMMNAVQYYIIDNFIMDKKKDSNAQKYVRVGGGEDDQDDNSHDERRRMMDDDDEEETRVVMDDARKMAEGLGEDAKVLGNPHSSTPSFHSVRNRGLNGEGSSQASSPRADDENRKVS